MLRRRLRRNILVPGSWGEVEEVLMASNLTPREVLRASIGAMKRKIRRYRYRKWPTFILEKDLSRLERLDSRLSKGDLLQVYLTKGVQDG